MTGVQTCALPIYTPPPTLGAHTDEVLGGIVGYDAEHHFFTVEAYDQPLASLSAADKRSPVG